MEKMSDDTSSGPSGISAGNAGDEDTVRRHGGWFIGHFIQDDPLRATGDVEVKWAFHTAGETKGSLHRNACARTMSILLQGRFCLTFRNDERDWDVLLVNKGDYVVWDAGVAHTWTALEDSFILTVRWPSCAGDQEQI